MLFSFMFSSTIFISLEMYVVNNMAGDHTKHNLPQSSFKVQLWSVSTKYKPHSFPFLRNTD